LAAAPTGFAARAQTIMAAIGTSSDEIAQSVASIEALIGEVRAAVQPPRARMKHTES
jgi:hypothetical protein